MSKILNAGRILVALCVKFYGLIDVLREPEDDNEITQTSRKVHAFHPNVRCRCYIGPLITKGTTVKEVRFRLTLKNLKNSKHVPMDATRR